MNDSTIPPQPGPGSGPAAGDTAQGGQPGSNGFFQWIRNLGIVRQSGDRWFAGVASGLAKKANIDATIVRGIFVVLAILGGPGLLLYLFGWLFLPDMTGKIHAEDLMRGRSTPGVIIGAIIVAFWILAGVFGPLNLSFGDWGLWNALGVPDGVTVTFTVLFWLAVAGAIAFFVHRSIVNHGNAKRASAADPTSTTLTPPPGTQAHFAAAPHSTPHAAGPETTGPHTMGFSESATHSAQDFSEKAEAWGRDFSEKADAWGKDISQKTDAWSAEYAERYEQSKLPMGQLFITLALALIAAATTFFWMNHTGISTSTVSGISAEVLGALIAGTAVLALSMILAGVRGRHSGTVGFLGFLGALAIIITLVMPWGSRFTFVGNQQIGTGAPGVAAFAGNITVDLTEFDDAPLDNELVVSQMFGNVDIMLPEDRPTQITLRIAAGRIHLTEDGRDSNTEVLTSGVLTDRTFTFNQGKPGRLLNVTVNLGGGNVELSYDPDLVQNSTPQHLFREIR